MPWPACLPGAVITICARPNTGSFLITPSHLHRTYVLIFDMRDVATAAASQPRMPLADAGGAGLPARLRLGPPRATAHRPCQELPTDPPGTGYPVEVRP